VVGSYSDWPRYFLLNSLRMSMSHKDEMEGRGGGGFIEGSKEGVAGAAGVV
jgi:hypothetical protein